VSGRARVRMGAVRAGPCKSDRATPGPHRGASSFAWHATVAFATWSLHAAGVLAQARTLVTLEYDVAAPITGCPTPDEFRARVARQLEYDPFRTDAQRRVSVRITAKTRGFDGRIQWSDAAGHWVGERRLSSERSECEAIAADLAFAVAVQIQLQSTLGPAGAGASAEGASGGGPASANEPAGGATSEEAQNGSAARDAGSKAAKDEGSRPAPPEQPSEVASSAEPEAPDRQHARLSLFA